MNTCTGRLIRCIMRIMSARRGVFCNKQCVYCLLCRHLNFQASQWLSSSLLFANDNCVLSVQETTS